MLCQDRTQWLLWTATSEWFNGSAELRAIASRHDFAKFKVNPSIILLLAGDDIPSTSFESFYRGCVWVSIKDAAFQPSPPWRHSAEMKKVSEEAKLLDDLQVLLLYTDGAPDHNITFMTAVVALLCLFLIGDLDFLIAARTGTRHAMRTEIALTKKPNNLLTMLERTLSAVG